jgi:eukaryotic-like serine/threonine-protein kinase
MICPSCGAESSMAGGRCAACLRPVVPDAKKLYATATITPIPDSEAETALASGDAVHADAAGSAGPLQPGAPFGHRYRILRVLGAGGMGVVYQAWDQELGVAVALKVIRPEVIADPFAAAEVERRFKRELLLARQVTHKHVVRIHDLGEVDGIKYLTMPYIEGRDLASLLHEGPLPVARAVRFAKEVAAGLLAAHEAGVVHRDLKPENVMIDADDNALIMDFGISRPIQSGGTMTAHGQIVGTLEYMSPEQGRGVHIDHRADIYAFGLMCYDMFAGRQRHAASSSALAELMSRMHHSPVALHTAVPAVPSALADVIDTCVEPDPDKRFQTTADLVGALDALDAEGHRRVARRSAPSRLRASAAAGVVLIVLGIGMAGGWLWSRNRRAPEAAAAREPVSVLIADFQNGTRDPVFQGSLEQALGIAMEGASFISTYSRTDAQRTLASIGGGRPLDEAGAKLVAAREGIKRILVGAIEPDGPGYVVSLKVVDPRSDQTLGTREVRAISKAAVLGAIGSLAFATRTVLGDTATVTSRAAEAETFTTTSLEAMRAYARGQELNAAGKPRDALKAFEAAVKGDPGFGRAYVNMASIYTNLKLDDQAKAHYEEALKHLDRMTPREKYRTRGLYYLGIQRDYEQAIANFERLVNEYPADNMGYANLALAYIYVRNIKKAVEVGKKATEIYPGNVLQRTNYATYSMYAGDFDTAVQQTAIVLKQNPSYEFAHLTLALSTLAKGDIAAAGAAYARLSAVSPLGRSLANMGEADLEIYLGRHRRAIDILANGIALDEKEQSFGNLAVKYVAMAEASLAIGDRNGAAVAAETGLRNSTQESVLFPAARVLLAAGQPARALGVSASMEKSLQTHTRSYGRLLKAAVALNQKRYSDALDGIRTALKMHDSWAGHALLAEAFYAAGQSAQAEEEWDRCVERRGEATDVFFADTSTLRYLSPIYYWLGRSQEAVGTVDGARHSFDAFLKLRTDADPPDPLAADARRRIGGS